MGDPWNQEQLYMGSIFPISSSPSDMQTFPPNTLIISTDEANELNQPLQERKMHFFPLIAQNGSLNFLLYLARSCQIQKGHTCPGSEQP